MRRGMRSIPRTAAGVLLVAAGVYLTFAAGVMFVLALTDMSGFVTNPASVGFLLVLLASGLAVGFAGIRTLDVRHRSHRE